MVLHVNTQICQNKLQWRFSMISWAHFLAHCADYTQKLHGQPANLRSTRKSYQNGTRMNYVENFVTNVHTQQKNMHISVLTGKKLVDVWRDMCQTWDGAIRCCSQCYRQAGRVGHERHHLVAIGNRSRSSSCRQDDVLSAKWHLIHVGNDSGRRWGLWDRCGWLWQTRKQLGIGAACLTCCQ